MISNYEGEERFMSGRLQSKVAIITVRALEWKAIAHKVRERRGARHRERLPDDPIEDVARTIRENGGERFPSGRCLG